MARSFSFKIRPLLLTLVALFYVFLFSALVNPPLPKTSESPLLYSNQAGSDLKLLYLDAFKNAKKSIYLEIYGLYDKDILSVLNKQALNGLNIKIRFDPTGSYKLQAKMEPAIELIPVKLPGLMHRKIAILDDHLLLLGSANLTSSSLVHHDNLVFVLDDEAFCRSILINNPAITQIGNQTLTVYKLPDKERIALPAIEKLLDSAQKTITVAMFTLTHEKLVEKLIEAKQRGVEVKVAIDYSTSNGASLKAIQRLSAASIPIIRSSGKQLLHHKYAIIDQTTLIMGSANWTNSAFKKNEDVILILELLNAPQKNLLRKVFRKIESEAYVDYESPSWQSAI